MRYLRDILLAFACTVVIVGVTANDAPLALENPEIMIARQTENVEGIPEVIQGVWVDEADSQSVILRGNQMITSDEENGTVYYTVSATQIEDRFETDGIEDSDSRMLYILTIDMNDYQMRYGEEEAAAIPTDTFYFVFDHMSRELIPQANVLLTRDETEELAYIVQDELIASQPINREQLQQVDNDYIVNAYWDHEQEGNQELMANLYKDIVNEFPDLELLTGDDFQRYQEISQEIIEHSDLTYSRLNQANPIKVLDLYEQAIDATPAQETDEVVASIYPDIQAEIQSYHDRMLSQENSLKFNQVAD